ncbi:MAG: hypothetical protein RBG13Loki_4164 [Promethearchaeota archaeon CR_4]|nr:MAG: hypothetical protein RBG13Loki_4164 [Candidatus Lokiarchaeota archaeon CR_4]
MSVVKLPDKGELDKLVANLTLHLGRKVSQQDVLTACIRLASTHLEELERFFGKIKPLSKTRVAEILKMGEDFEYVTKGTIDEDLYGDGT